MRILSKEETERIHTFLKMRIPQYVREYSDEQFDLMDCYEVGFMYANDLLKNKKINPYLSPWGEGKSVIFDPSYTALLLRILKENVSEEMDRYCQIYLDVIDVFKRHFV